MEYSDDENFNYELSEDEKEEEKHVQIINQISINKVSDKPDNMKCSSCKKKFYYNSKVNNICCCYCGCRILHKLRTKDSIYYNSN
jgi:DNA-directed RNA polymerase subunit RPC12/RpoP